MPNPLAITLHASAAETTSGTGTAVDAGLRTYTEVTLDVTALGSSSSVTVTIESSPTQSSWVALGHFQAVAALGVKTVTIPDGFKYLRAKWTVTGTVTFTVTGEAHQLYATPKDVAKTGIAKGALEAVPVGDIAQACLNASSEAEGYLAASNTLPIESIDAATRQHIARMALFEVMRFRSRGAAADATGMLEIGRSDALTWLNRIATGKLRPPGLVDATPDTVEAGSPTDLYVISGAPRRW